MAEDALTDDVTDSGSAVAEFALVASLLALILAGALQIGLVIHVRNTVIDSAIAGARQASLADQSPRDGKRLTSDLIRVSVGERYAQKVTVSTSRRGAVEIIGGPGADTAARPRPVGTGRSLGSAWTLHRRGHRP